MSMGEKIDLLEFARRVGDGSKVSRTQYIEEMKRVIPLDSLRDITPEESEALLMSVTWLYDYCLLLWEFHQAELRKSVKLHGAPCVPGCNGPWIKNMLTREGCPDFSPLKHFNVLCDVD